MAPHNTNIAHSRTRPSTNSPQRGPFGRVRPTSHAPRPTPNALVSQSANGTSTSIPSLATLAFGNTSRASFTSSSAEIEYRADT
jgi:hypothetical protein